MLDQLRLLAQKTLADCTHVKEVDFAPGEMALLLPSGDEKYVAFWVRDAAMMAESGLIPDGDLRRYVSLIATYGQNGAETVHLLHGLEIPPYAITDHINYNGKPVFFPGTYADGEDQGDGIWGSYPPFCDNYYFIDMAGQYIRQSGDRGILDEVFAGMTLSERMKHAYEGYNLGAAAEGRPAVLCVSQPGRHTVDWGFTDSVVMQGALLFASLLRWRAARVMDELFPGEGYRDAAEVLAGEIISAFYDQASGWMWSSTGEDRQHDVWGTAFAVYLGLLPDDAADRTAQVMADAYRAGIAGVYGYIRHILTTEDAVPGVTAWAKCGVPIDLYQNGTYWATPLGWYAVAVARVDRPLALELFSSFLEHTQTYADQGAPFEWMFRDTSCFSGCLYGTSGVLPYTGAVRILV